MSNRKSTFVCAFVLFVTMVGAAHAWSPVRKMYLTFSGPVALPGVTLPTGTYVFEQVTDTSASLVRVFNASHSKLYLQNLTIPVSRPAGMSRDRTIVFSETQPGIPPRIESWFPQDESVGHKFVY